MTYFGDESPFELTTMWRKNNPKSTQRPFCVATRLGGSFKFLSVYQNLFKRGRATTVGLIQTATSVRVPTVGIGRHLKDLEILFFFGQTLSKIFQAFEEFGNDFKRKLSFLGLHAVPAPSPIMWASLLSSN